MHYKRTSASQTPNVRNLTKQLDISRYLKNTQKKQKEILGKNGIKTFEQKPKVFSSSKAAKTVTKIIKTSNPRISPINSASEKKVYKEPTRKVIKISNTTEAKDSRSGVPSSGLSEKRFFKNSNQSITSTNQNEPRRWHKAMKSVDLKARNNYRVFPRQERIRIIKSPPPSVGF